MSDNSKLVVPPEFEALLVIAQENGTRGNLLEFRNAIRKCSRLVAK
jgi:hypothetical protein